MIAWERLRNPILSYVNVAAKDMTLVRHDGRWHLFFSAIDLDGHWSIGRATSLDLASWSDPPELWPDQPGTLGLASPEIVRDPDGVYVAVYQSQPGECTGESKLYYRRSLDLAAWSAARPLGWDLHPGRQERMIDAAVAWTDSGLLLGYKLGLKDGERQHFELARSRSGGLDGPWELLGRPRIEVYRDTVENYQFLSVDGAWHLLATSNSLNRPWLFRRAVGTTGDADGAGWLDWEDGSELEVPVETWNTRPGGISGWDYEQANCAYLYDARGFDGHFYLFYAGSTELDTFDGWGHARIGVARSTDLYRWEVPSPPIPTASPRSPVQGEG